MEDAIKKMIAEMNDPRNDGYVQEGIRRELEQLKQLIEKGLAGNEGKDWSIH